MRGRELEKWSGYRPPRRMRDAEVWCEARADEFLGFGSASSTLEEPREEPSDNLCNVFNEYFLEVRSGMVVNVPRLSQDYRLPAPTMSSGGVSPIPRTCLQPLY